MQKVTEVKPALTFLDFYRRPMQFLNFVGLKLFAWHVGDVWTRSEKIRIVCVVLNSTVNLFALSTFGMFEEFEDMLHMAEWILYMAFAANGVLKIVSVWLGRSSLGEVMKDLEKLFPTKPEQQHKAYNALMPHVRFLCGMHWTVALMFIFFPITQSSVEYLLNWREDGAFVYRYPYTMTYPFDYHQPLPYLPLYFMQFLAGVSISVFFLSGDLLLVVCIHLLETRFQHLAERIRHFKPKHPQVNLKELKAVLETHSYMLNLAERINEIFSVSIFLNFFISIVVICLIGFQVAAGSETFQSLKFIGFLIASLLDIYIICHFGTELIITSSDVAEDIAGQEWYCADLPYQRMLPLIIARCQKSAHLTAYKFFPIDMKSFTNVVTTSYQFFTLIKTSYDKAKQSN